MLVTQLEPDALRRLPSHRGRAARRRHQHRGKLEAAKLGKQLKYADRAGIRFAVLMGTDEQARGAVTLKDLTKAEQHDVPRAELAERVRGLL